MKNEYNKSAKATVIHNNQRNKAGFTVPELLVTISVLTLIGAILIVHSRSSERQILLFREQAKVISTFLRAKSLAFNAYLLEAGGAPCAYGVHVDTEADELIIFRDLDANQENALCDDSSPDAEQPGQGPNYRYDYTPERPEEYLGTQFVIAIDERITIETEFTDIVFIPPDPRVVITNDGELLPPDRREAVLELILPDGTSKKVKVNRFGQVSVE